MKRKVLIAEDEPALLESYSELITALGHECLLACDGNEAIAVARSHRPDLVVTDFMMPGRTGLEVIAALKRDPLLSALPVILITAGRPRETELRNAWLTLKKPVPLEQFEDAIRKGLAAGAAASAPGGSSVAAPEDASHITLAREEMLGWVSHEIKSPLAAALTATQLAMRDLDAGVDPQSLRRRMAIIARQLGRMDELANSILDAAQLQSGNLKLDLEDIDLGEWLNDIVAFWEDLNPEYEFTLSNGHGVVLSADRERLRQIIENLISNAVKYARSSRRVLVDTEALEDSVRIHVKDEGPGIPPEQLSTIFNRFQRVPGQAGRGHGLGLYIAAALARLHGGLLSVESEVGKGSTFTLTLPRKLGAKVTSS
jgi:two-component system, sensor histidine kinase and response regulator